MVDGIVMRRIGGVGMMIGGAGVRFGGVCCALGLRVSSRMASMTTL